jgi:Tol biopolymer transport system component
MTASGCDHFPESENISAPGPFGGIRVTTRTTGVDLDATGYEVSAAGSVRRMPSSGTITLGRLPASDYLVTFSDIAANCEPTDAAPRIVTVLKGDTAAITFDVVCARMTQLVYVDSVGSSNRDIFVINTDGRNVSRLTRDVEFENDPTWSPDGSRIAFTRGRDPDTDLYVMNADGSNVLRLTNDAFTHYRPAWSPDGQRIAFVTERDGNADIYVMDADGRGATRLTNDPRRDADPAWSPDGLTIAFARASGVGNDADIYVMNADGTNPVRLTNTPDRDFDPAWSPDGSRLAFARAWQQGMQSVIVTMNADGSVVAPVLVAVGSRPSWSPDGRLIAFEGYDCDFYYGCYYGVISTTVRIVRPDGTNLLDIRSPAYSPAWRR